MRQRTLRNLGRHVALPRGDGPALCARVERILAPQRSLEFGACCPAVEDEAQRSAAQLVQAGVSPVGPAAPADGADDPSAALPRVDVDSLELVRPRSVGVEHVALWAARHVALAAPAQRPGRAARLRLRDHGPERPAARQRPPAAPPRHETALQTLHEGLSRQGTTHPGVHGPRTSSVGWDAGRLWRTCVTRTDLEAVLRSLGSALGPRPIHHRRPTRSAGHLCLSVLACQADGRMLHARKGDAGRVLAAGDPRAAGRGRLAGRGPQAGRPAQTTKGTCTEWSAHTPDSAAAMCSLQTTHAMGWQTGAGGLDCGCAIAGKQCLESLP